MALHNWVGWQAELSARAGQGRGGRHSPLGLDRRQNWQMTLGIGGSWTAVARGWGSSKPEIASRPDGQAQQRRGAGEAVLRPEGVRVSDELAET